jgi:hypothetical protein
MKTPNRPLSGIIKAEKKVERRLKRREKINRILQALRLRKKE